MYNKILTCKCFKHEIQENQRFYEKFREHAFFRSGCFSYLEKIQFSKKYIKFARFDDFIKLFPYTYNFRTYQKKDYYYPGLCMCVLKQMETKTKIPWILMLAHDKLDSDYVLKKVLDEICAVGALSNFRNLLYLVQHCSTLSFCKNKNVIKRAFDAFDDMVNKTKFNLFNGFCWYKNDYKKFFQYCFENRDDLEVSCLNWYHEGVGFDFIKRKRLTESDLHLKAPLEKFLKIVNNEYVWSPYCFKLKLLQRRWLEIYYAPDSPYVRNVLTKRFYNLYNKHE